MSTSTMLCTNFPIQQGQQMGKKHFFEIIRFDLRPYILTIGLLSFALLWSLYGIAFNEAISGVVSIVTLVDMVRKLIKKNGSNGK